jgi:hypothetical protein
MPTSSLRIVSRAALAALCVSLFPALAQAADPLLIAAAPRDTASRARKAVESSSSGVGKLDAEALLGLGIPFESGVNTGFKMEAGAFYGLQELSPTMLLQIGGKLAFEYNGLADAYAFGSSGGSFFFFDIVPTARLRFTINDKLYAVADGGAGLGIVHFSYDVPGFAKFSDTSGAFLLKLGGGIGYDVNEKFAVVGQPALNIYLKSGSVTVLSLMVGASMKL